MTVCVCVCVSVFYLALVSIVPLSSHVCMRQSLCKMPVVHLTEDVRNAAVEPFVLEVCVCVCVCTRMCVKVEIVQAVTV